MKFIVSWWDNKEGIGIATSESGTECLLHHSNLSPNQCKTLKNEMVIHGETKQVSKGIYIVEKVRIATKTESKSYFKKLSREAVAA